MRHLGFDVVTRNFYSPIPDLKALPADVFTRASALRGIVFDLDAQLRFVRQELGPFLGELRVPLYATGEPGRFHLANSTYEGVDAETLYAMIRRFRPRRIIELGSGATTLLMAQARQRNGAEGHPAEQRAYDPFPRADLLQDLRRAADVRAVSATEVGAEEVTAMEAGDLLFVDSTHTVKIAGDVNHVVLDLLPLVPPGVLVHVHDIFWPYEYPEAYFTELDVYWAEQYLLQAYVAQNPDWELLFANHGLWRDRASELRALVSTPSVPTGPSALWLRRRQQQPS